MGGEGGPATDPAGQLTLQGEQKEPAAGGEGGPGATQRSRLREQGVESERPKYLLQQETQREKRNPKYCSEKRGNPSLNMRLANCAPLYGKAKTAFQFSLFSRGTEK